MELICYLQISSVKNTAWWDYTAHITGTLKNELDIGMQGGELKKYAGKEFCPLIKSSGL